MCSFSGARNGRQRVNTLIYCIDTQGVSFPVPKVVKSPYLLPNIAEETFLLSIETLEIGVASWKAPLLEDRYRAPGCIWEGALMYKKTITPLLT